MTDARFIPDSALLLNGRPMFYPDFADGWQLRPFTALHIHRLGKGVDARFASRYYDTCALAFLLEPGAGAVPPGLVNALDGCITMCRPMTPAEFAGVDSVDAAGTEIRPAWDEATAAAAIETISAYTQLKMGDIILLPHPAPAIRVCPHSKFEVKTPDGETILSQKIV